MQRDKAVLNVRHVTTYRYARPVEFGEHRMMMRPRDGHDQRLVASELLIEPRPARLRWLYDAFDNCVALASFSGASTALTIENRFTVERTADNSPGGEIDPRARLYPFSYQPEELPDISRSIERLYEDPAGDLDRWAHQFATPGGTTQTSHLLMTLTYAIKEGFSYERREESGVQPPRETLDRRRGSCRDFAVLMMEAAARPRHRRPIRLRLYLRAARGRTSPCGSGAARRTPGARCICRAPAGSNSIRPTA